MDTTRDRVLADLDEMGLSLSAPTLWRARGGCGRVLVMGAQASAKLS